MREQRRYSTHMLRVFMGSACVHKRTRATALTVAQWWQVLHGALSAAQPH